MHHNSEIRETYASFHFLESQQWRRHHIPVAPVSTIQDGLT